MAPSFLLGACELLLVAVLWGATNPLLNRASRPKQAGALTEQQAADAPQQSSSSPSILALLRNYRFLVPFLLNQSGSIVYLHALSHLAVSFAVPIVNALTMVITAVTAFALGEKQRVNARVLVGMATILAGITLCVLSQHWQQQARELETGEHATASLDATPPR